jgi:hypothetical protein
VIKDQVDLAEIFDACFSWAAGKRRLPGPPAPIKMRAGSVGDGMQGVE